MDVSGGKVAEMDAQGEGYGSRDRRPEMGALGSG